MEARSEMNASAGVRPRFIRPCMRGTGRSGHGGIRSRPCSEWKAALGRPFGRRQALKRRKVCREGERERANKNAKLSANLCKVWKPALMCKYVKVK